MKKLLVLLTIGLFALGAMAYAHGPGGYGGGWGEADIGAEDLEQAGGKAWGPG